MRLITVALGGSFLAAVMIAACGGPGPDSNASTATGGSDGTPIDGMQACIEAFSLNGELCPPADPDPVSTCKDIFQNAGPECEDEKAVEFDCFRDFEKAQDPSNHTCPLPWPDECLGLSQDAYSCASKYGCTQILPETCYSNPGPNGEEGCKCKRNCMQVLYEARCWASGTTSTCDCVAAGVSVGTCEGGPTPACDKYLLESCCNQYFMLSF